MALTCEDCNRTFTTKGALDQHLRDSPAHAVTFECDECNRTFDTEQALQQHIRDSPAHAVTYDCDECDRTFNTEQALQQHIQDSPAHVVTYDCNECNRTFDTEQALQQHLRDSPAHAVTYRTFDTEQAFQQHLRDSLAHIGFSAAGISQSFNLQPGLHDEVLQLLRAYDLAFDFFATDDPRGILNEHDTSIMGGQAGKSPSRYDNTLGNDTTLESTFSAANHVGPSADLSWTNHMQKECRIAWQSGPVSL